MHPRIAGSIRFSLVPAMAVALAACGGGGGGGGQQNRPPQLTASSFSGDEETTITGQVTASDPEGDTFTLALAGQANHGTVTMGADGAFVFHPTVDFFGTATFSVVATDARGASATLPVSITVRNVNDAPVAHDDELRVGTGAVTLSLLANDVDVDNDTLSVTPLSQPRGGTISVTGGNVVTFTPENAFAGPTSFSYRITDAGGVTSDATAKLVVGGFPGVLFVADATTPGTRELHFYDGFRTVRVNAALPAGASLVRFTLASDQRHVAYLVSTANFEEIFLADLTQPGSARLLYTTAALPSFGSTMITLNKDASFALITDATHPSALKTVLVRTADSTVSVIGASNPELLGPGFYAAFNPVTNEFYVQAQVGGQPPPMTGSGYLSLFAATTSAPDPLTRIGPSYVPDHGSGAGWLPAVTADGQRVVHIGFTSMFPQSGVKADLLLNHRPSNSDNFAFRPFALFEYTTPVRFALSNDGARACYILFDSPPNNGPARVWFSDLAAAANGTAASSSAVNTFDCRWAADNHTIAYTAASAVADEAWIADALQPGTARRVREPLAAGERISYFDVARRSMTAVVGVNPSGSPIPDFYRAAVDAPGTSVKFATGSFVPSGILPIQMNAHGTLLGYGKQELIGGGPQTQAFFSLHLMSTQTLDYDWILTRPDATAGVTSFEFVSPP